MGCSFIEGKGRKPGVVGEMLSGDKRSGAEPYLVGAGYEFSNTGSYRFNSGSWFRLHEFKFSFIINIDGKR